MNMTIKMAIVVGLAVAVAGAVALRPAKRPGGSTASTVSPPAKPLPRPVDLGADKCIPCKLMAPMLGVTCRMASTNAVYGASLLLAYGVGHCAVIVRAGTFTERVQRYLDWNEQCKGVKVLKYVCGVLVPLGGVYLIHTAL